MSEGEPKIVGPDAALVQATADLLAARVELCKEQPWSRLIPCIDRAVESLLSPTLIARA